MRRCWQQDAGNVQALAGLARCYVETGDDRAGQADARPGAGGQAQRCGGRGRARRARARRAGEDRSGRSPSSKHKVAANPLDHQARFDLALALNAKGKREEAVDHLIEIVKRDRKWNDDGARKQLVQFFEAWGPTDEATVDGRKRLSSILFA